ncbi:hypothetical protein ACFYZT_26775 [Streptomyces sp. NPDC001591]|uniref:hypothetical protein n=1 Tax=Streptomyces sp. NPDC001591 TaxID=3364589 RepID=UPI00369BA8D8
MTRPTATPAAPAPGRSAPPGHPAAPAPTRRAVPLGTGPHIDPVDRPQPRRQAAGLPEDHRTAEETHP